MIKHSKEEILLIKNDTVSRFFSEEGGTMKHKAFTLLEILIAIIIVGIIAGIILLNSGASTSKAEQTACLGNRESFEHAYSLYKMGMTNPMTLESFIKTDDKDALKYMDKLGKCPSGGVYSVSEDTATGRYHVVCSIHKDVIVASSGGSGSGSGGSGSGQLIPGTTVYTNGTWPTWEELIAKGGSITLKAGTTFYYNGKYYFAIHDTEITSGGLTKGTYSPNGWWFNDGGLQYINTSGTVAAWQHNEWNDKHANGATMGKIYTYDSNYYICNISSGSDWTDPPASNQWTLLK